MQIPTDHIVLLQTLGAYAFGASTPTELAGKLQTIPGSTVDRIFTATEMLYAFRDQLQTDGLNVLGELTGFALANHWDFPGQSGRMQAIYDSTSAALGETQLPAGFEQPAPVVAYRTDQKDWRAGAPINLDALKAGKCAQVDNVLGEKFFTGFVVPAGGGSSPVLPAALVGKTLQTRPGTDDATNWLTSQAAYTAQVSAGNGATVAAKFRDAANETVTVSYQDGLNVLLAMAAWGASLFDNSWMLKDQIGAIQVVTTDANGNPIDPTTALQTAVTQLDAININSGWPT